MIKNGAVSLMLNQDEDTKVHLIDHETKEEFFSYDPDAAAKTGGGRR